MAENSLIGKKITKVIRLSKKEVDDLGWYESTVCLVLEDGTKLFPSQDEEGNGPGSFFGIDKDKNMFVLG